MTNNVNFSQASEVGISYNESEDRASSQLTSKGMKMTSQALKKKLGQNTAEYLIMLTLVAVASIGLFSVFGKTLRNKIAYVSAAISGDTTHYTETQENTITAAEAAKTRANDNEVLMRGQEVEELSSGAGE